jgi:hypothetical protein
MRPDREPGGDESVNQVDRSHGEMVRDGSPACCRGFEEW